MANKKFAIEMKNINKSFGGIYALKDVTFKVQTGTCHGLVGENGAGKSTLMNVLYGVLSKDSGEIFINDEIVEIKSINDSRNLGLALVPQELSFIPYLTVAENIYLGNETLKKGSIFLDKSQLNKNAVKLLKDLKIDLPIKKLASELSVSEQQMMVIARILSKNPEIIIMDEPTARIGENETKKLLDYINILKEANKTIVYISHRLEEIFQICDNITVLRDGQTINTLPTDEVNEEELIHMMCNREIIVELPLDTKHEIGETILSVKDLRKADELKNINFNVRKGEVLGFFGLVGAGRTETIRAILGIDSRDGGEVWLEGKQINLHGMSDALKNGIALVPEERRKQGVILSLPIYENISLGNLEQYAKCGIISKSKEKVAAKSASKDLQVNCTSVEQLVGNLSGGNQQKVVIAKYLNRDIKIIIFDEPTRGIDVGAKKQIYQIIDRLAAQGIAVIVISSEILEIQLICDRLLVMKDGEIVSELARQEFITSTNILKEAVGIQ